MSRLQLSILAGILSLLLASFAHSAALPESNVSSRSKRQSADVRAAEYLAYIALGGNMPDRGCKKVACGVVDVYSRVRRSSADQRIAELQALLALSNRSRNRSAVAHGMFDPSEIGKKKKNMQGESLSEEDRYNLLRALVERAAIENSVA